MKVRLPEIALDSFFISSVSGWDHQDGLQKVSPSEVLWCWSGGTTVLIPWTKCFSLHLVWVCPKDKSLRDSLYLHWELQPCRNETWVHNNFLLCKEGKEFCTAVYVSDPVQWNLAALKILWKPVPAIIATSLNMRVQRLFFFLCSWLCLLTVTNRKLVYISHCCRSVMITTLFWHILKLDLWMLVDMIFFCKVI